MAKIYDFAKLKESKGEQGNKPADKSGELSLEALEEVGGLIEFVKNRMYDGGITCGGVKFGPTITFMPGTFDLRIGIPVSYSRNVKFELLDNKVKLLYQQVSSSNPFIKLLDMGVEINIMVFEEEDGENV